jgi:hypothetical protein
MAPRPALTRRCLAFGMLVSLLLPAALLDVGAAVAASGPGGGSGSGSGGGGSGSGGPGGGSGSGSSGGSGSNHSGSNSGSGSSAQDDGAGHQGGHDDNDDDDGEDGVRLDQRAAQRGVQQGQLKPLAQILATVQRAKYGQVIAVDLARRTSGQTYYRVTIVSEAGEYWQVMVDARQNTIIGMRRH